MLGLPASHRGGTIRCLTQPADISGCFERLAWTEIAVRDLNETARQYALMDWDEKKAAAMLTRARIEASNIVHQLRSSLDNLVCELVTLNEEAVTTVTAFPVRSTTGRKARDAIDRKLCGISDEHRDVILRLQPSQPIPGAEDQGPDKHPLEQLEDLWNRDKHRLLISLEHKDVSLDVAGTGPGGVPGTRLVYEDGEAVVVKLRRALAAVDLIVRAFEPAFRGETVNLDWTRAEIDKRTTAFLVRDPAAIYQKEWSFINLAIPHLGELDVKMLTRLHEALMRTLSLPDVDNEDYQRLITAFRTGDEQVLARIAELQQP